MYSFCSISDVHVRNSSDERYELLLTFMRSSQVKESKTLLFLGDIFDLMVGNHEEYIKEYQDFFDLLKEFSDKEIVYFEGNHDLHLRDLFNQHVPNAKLVKDEFVIKSEETKIHFSHGDNFDVDNLPYQRYKKILNSKPFDILANKIVPYNVVKFIGENASKVSRKRNSNMREDAHGEWKASYRKNIKKILQAKYDFVIFGHSHFEEDHKFSDSKVKIYNNGFFPDTKKFIMGYDQKIELVSLV